MRSPAELEVLCQAIRGSRIVADAELVAQIESDINSYREMLTTPRPEIPPDPPIEHLWFIGWLLLEASLQLVRDIPAQFDSQPSAATRERAINSHGLVKRLANCARALPWPEFAPRALGAIRALALAESKRDTPEGYDAAWEAHRDARDRHNCHRDHHRGFDGRERYLLGLRETMIQLALAETGTACRTAERVISQWGPGAFKDVDLSADDERDWLERMFGQLTSGVAVGFETIDLVEMTRSSDTLVFKVTDRRMALNTAFRNPGVMTARAALLMLAMYPQMEAYDREPLDDAGTWLQARDQIVDSFRKAYSYIEDPVFDQHGVPMPLIADHQRSVIQLRLNFALLAPNSHLPSNLDFDDCLQNELLDETAVEALSAWLAEPVKGKRRGDANVIGSAAMAEFIASVEACRKSYGVTEGYRDWRRRWFELDRFADQTGRRETILKVLGNGR